MISIHFMKYMIESSSEELGWCCHIQYGWEVLTVEEMTTHRVDITTQSSDGDIKWGYSLI